MIPHSMYITIYLFTRLSYLYIVPMSALFHDRSYDHGNSTVY